jgi:hypothetical protein
MPMQCMRIILKDFRGSKNRKIMADIHAPGPLPLLNPATTDWKHKKKLNRQIGDGSLAYQDCASADALAVNHAIRAKRWAKRRSPQYLHQE